MGNRLRAEATGDGAWKDIAQYEQQLEAILECGFETESDVIVVKKAILIVLAELIMRRTAMMDYESGES